MSCRLRCGTTKKKFHRGLAVPLVHVPVVVFSSHQRGAYLPLNKIGAGQTRDGPHPVSLLIAGIPDAAEG